MANRLQYLAAWCVGVGIAYGAPSLANAQSVQAAYTSKLIANTPEHDRVVDFNNQGVVLFNVPTGNGMPGSMWLWDTNTDTSKALPFSSVMGLTIDDAQVIYGYQYLFDISHPGGYGKYGLFDAVAGSKTETPVGYIPEKSIKRPEGDVTSALIQSLGPAPLNGTFSIDSVVAINQQGQILATGTTWSRYPSTWVGVFTPVPEASTSALMLLGLCATGWAARRRSAVTQPI